MSGEHLQQAFKKLDELEMRLDALAKESDNYYQGIVVGVPGVDLAADKNLMLVPSDILETSLDYDNAVDYLREAGARIKRLDDEIEAAKKEQESLAKNIHAACQILTAVMDTALGCIKQYSARNQ